jgi:hypothetical protein
VRGKAEVLQFFERVGGAWDPLELDVESVGELDAPLD